MNHPFANRSREAVFLCYHSIADRGSSYLALAPSIFEEQLAHLSSRGFRSGGVADLRRLDRGERLPGMTAFLTFDDGYLDNAEVAMPLMRKYGFRPMIFVIPGRLEHGDGFDWPELAADYAASSDVMRAMTWDMVERIIGEGAEIGSHTMTHPHLVELGEDELATELGESKALIEKRLGDCPTLAYPFGEWSPTVRRVARAVGYSFAFTLPQGPHSVASADPLGIPRINIDNRDTGRRFALKLSGLGRQLLLSELGEWARGARAVLPGARR